jgi:hypothetical protein
MPIDPDNDPNEAYEIGHLPPRPHDLPPDWWMLFCNRILVRHFTPAQRDRAERYCSDAAYRLSCQRKYIHA